MRSVKLTLVEKESILAYIFDLTQDSSRPMDSSDRPAQRKQKLDFRGSELESTRPWDWLTCTRKSSESFWHAELESTRRRNGLTRSEKYSEPKIRVTMSN